ncbi:MAG: DNA polymerase IV [Actinobacteria bacterium HGW-Actinobacteria-10]|nr:MAG: DNA polymerase IV [Actinobacteria bacterium HGW-Actinobacteria-10]
MNDPTHIATPWHGRAVLHLDMDAFFAAVEQLDHPEWRGRPVIVGGSPDGRGVVSTASYEARRYGIGSAMPSARAARLAPPDTIWAPPRFERYKELSDQVFEIMRDYSPELQPLSIDEAFIDVTPGVLAPRDPADVAREISARVDTMGITCSIGVASGKTVAKIASDYRKPHGITVVRPGQEASFLAPLPIEVMSGIGPKSASRLRSHGIRTLGELAALDEGSARDLLGSHGSRMVERARGIDTRPVHQRDPVKSVSNERTFATDLRDAEEIRTVIHGLADRVGRRLRRKSMAGRTIHVKVRFSDFTTRTVQRTLDAPTDDEATIAPVAHELVATVWNPGVGVRLLGVGVTGLDERAQQLDLFSAAGEPVPEAVAATEPTGRRTEASPREPDSQRAARLARGIDAVREKFGEDAVVRGSRRFSPKTTGTPAGSYSGDEDPGDGGKD